MSTNNNGISLHPIITLLLMFGIGFLPAFGAMTPLGMKMLGVLVGMIYGITTCGGFWPSLIGMAALPILGIAPMAQVFTTGIGSDSVMLMIFFFIFVDVLSENKITEFLASWILSRKFVAGKPWLYSYVLIVGTMFSGALGSSFPAMIVFWSVLISTCKMYHIKPFTKYPTVMFMGICLGGLASSSTWLFRGNPLFVNAALKQISDGIYSFNFGLYAFFSFAIWMIMLGAYVLLCKYGFKIDLSMMSDIGSSDADLTLTKRQKVIFGYMILVLASYCGIGFVPATTTAGKYFATWGVSGPIFIILFLMMLTKIDGQDIMHFQTSARNGVIWETVLLSGALLSVATIMMTADTGLAKTLIDTLTPVFAGHGPVFMSIIIVLISVVLTNFMANTTVGLMFTPVVYSFSQLMGFNPMPVMAMLLVSIHIAYLTPAASPFASLLFGNSSWVKASDIYKHGTLTCLVMVAIFLLIGIPLSVILF